MLRVGLPSLGIVAFALSRVGPPTSLFAIHVTGMALYVTLVSMAVAVLVFNFIFFTFSLNLAADPFFFLFFSLSLPELVENNQKIFTLS